MRLSLVSLIIFTMLYQSINAGGDWKSLQKVLAQQDAEKALLHVYVDSELTKLVERHFVVMKAFDKASNKQESMWLFADLDLIHAQMEQHLSK